jgi:hypothetical protein
MLIYSNKVSFSKLGFSGNGRAHDYVSKTQEELTFGVAMTCSASLRLEKGLIQTGEIERLDASGRITLHGGNGSAEVGKRQ